MEQVGKVTISGLRMSFTIEEPAVAAVAVSSMIGKAVTAGSTTSFMNVKPTSTTLIIDVAGREGDQVRGHNELHDWRGDRRRLHNDLHEREADLRRLDHRYRRS